MAIEMLDLIRNNDGIPSLPVIFARINEAVEDPRSSMRDIANIISTDQSLSARLLRLVNSAFFGFPSKIDTISHAVTIVGTRQLRDLSLATSIIQMFKGIPGDLVDMTLFWQHCIGCGITARLLASFHNETNIEQFFVTGLLHDIGRLILYQKNSDQMKEILSRTNENSELMYLVEREVMGFDHTDVGGLLLMEWQLPENLEEPVKYHHRPAQASRNPNDSRIVHVADLIANAMELGTSGERLVPPLDGSAWDEIGFSSSILGPLIKQVDQQYSDTVNLLLDE